MLRLALSLAYMTVEVRQSTPPLVNWRESCHEQSMDSDDEFTVRGTANFVHTQSTPPLVNWRESCLGDDEYDTDLDHVLYTIDEVTQELLKEGQLQASTVMKQNDRHTVCVLYQRGLF